MEIVDYFYARKDQSKRLVAKALRRAGLKKHEVESAFVDALGEVFLKIIKQPNSSN